VGALPCSAPGRRRAGRFVSVEQTALRPTPVPPFQEAELPLLILFRPALLLFTPHPYIVTIAALVAGIRLLRRYLPAACAALPFLNGLSLLHRRRFSVS